MRKACLVVVVLGLLLPGCGQGGEQEGPVAAPKSLPGSPPEVEAALLTTEDLGDDWTDIGPTPFDERGLQACPPTNVLTSEEDPSRLGEAQTHFLQQQEGEEDPPPPLFFESVSLWESEQVARERLSVFATATTTCVGVTGPMPDGGRATVTFADRAVPDLGDETVGQTARFVVEDGPDATLDLIAVRLGDVVVLTNAERSDEGLDSAELVDLTRRAVDKLEQRLPLS